MMEANAMENMRFTYTILEQFNAGRKIGKSTLKTKEIEILNEMIKAGGKIVLENGFYFKKDANQDA
ncbi:MAG: hypothetical protein PHI97_07485 [Desulfobulbus sp.]|nr:hypothetical protein [Desulfobulbus sp.]